ncbi:UNVERIFIED_CONTAM: hypothetical protein GTU68_056821 [Idotea baltica]|nr:hypothetical protein [Idotea baltica]
MAHNLEPVVLIGKGLLSTAVVKEIQEALAAHELIKVKFLEGKDERKILAERVASATCSNLVGLVGNVAMLYKQNQHAKNRKIRLPH